MIRFSIIVPVYNVKMYLEECLNSIVEQDFADYELLLINDGSTDGSETICESYASRYSNIRYFSKSNGGLSDARNYGIERAMGQYVIFIDSDDWIKKGALSSINEVVEKNSPDVIITKLIEVYPDDIKDKDSDFDDYLREGFDYSRAIRWNFEKSGNIWPAQKTIVLKELIDSHGLRYKKGRVHEDLDWTSRLFTLAQSFAGYSEDWYYHRMKRPGSITSEIRAKNFVDTIEMAADLYDDLSGSSKKEDHLILLQAIKSVYAKLNQINRCSKADREEVSDVIEKNKRIFSIAPAFKYKVFAFSIRCLGAATTLKMLAALKGNRASLEK